MIVGRRASVFCWLLDDGHPQLLEATHSSLSCGPLHKQLTTWQLASSELPKGEAGTAHLLISRIMGVTTPHACHIYENQDTGPAHTQGERITQTYEHQDHGGLVESF